jgi:hypothetical protein
MKVTKEPPQDAAAAAGSKVAQSSHTVCLETIASNSGIEPLILDFGAGGRKADQWYLALESDDRHVA